MIDYGILNSFSVTGSIGLDEGASLEDTFAFYDAKDFAKAYFIMDFLKKRLEKLRQKQEVIDELTYEKKLLENDALSIIKDDLANSRFNIFRMTNKTDLLWRAWRYFNCKKDGTLSELGNDDFESAFDFVKEVVEKSLIPDCIRDSVTLKEFVDYGYASFYEFGYEYESDGKRLEFTISVPMFSSANDKNYMEILQGYTLKYSEKEGIIKHAFSEIDHTKFKNRLGEWIEGRLGNNGKQD